MAIKESYDRWRIRRATKTLREASKGTLGVVAEPDMSQALLDFLGLDRSQSADALSEATYFACIKILSETIGKMPLKVMRRDEDGGVTTMTRHPLYRMLHDRPNPYQTATQFWSKVEFDRNHYGNAYVWIHGAGREMTLWLMPHDRVTVYYDNACALADVPDVYYVYNDGRTIHTLGSEEVMHFKASQTTDDGIIGVSIREQLASTIGGSVDSQEMLNRMYESGFTAKAVLNYTGSLNDENVETLVAGIEDYAKGNLRDSGVENIIPIPLGFSLQPLNVKLADNEYVEVRQYTSGQIAAAFGIKPYQYNDLTKSSYASVEAQQLSFYVDTLLYIIQSYEQEIGYKLLSAGEYGRGVYVAFNSNVILRTDPEKQMQILRGYAEAGIYSRNECRGKLEMPSLEGCDEPLCNGTNIPVRLAGQQYEGTETHQGGDSNDEQQ